MMSNKQYLVITMDCGDIESYITDEDGVRRVIKAHIYDDESPEGIEVYEIGRRMSMVSFPPADNDEEKEIITRMITDSFNSFLTGREVGIRVASIGTPAYDRKDRRRG